MYLLLRESINLSRKNKIHVRHIKFGLVQMTEDLDTALALTKTYRVMLFRVYFSQQAGRTHV